MLNLLRTKLFRKSRNKKPENEDIHGPIVLYISFSLALIVHKTQKVVKWMNN